MQFPPFSSLRTTLRVLLKALLLVALINVICVGTGFNPVAAVTRFNLWGIVGGRARLMYMSDVQNGQLPVDSLIATHEIAHKPKLPDEFRVVILGNSGPFGAGLADDETLAAQLTGRGIRLDGKRLVAYNLAYPSATVVISTVILDAALVYQPDLVISFITANMFNNREDYWDEEFVFYLLNRERLESIAARYNMTDWLSTRLSPRPFGYEWLGIRDNGTFAVWLGSLFYPFVEPDIRRTSWRIAQDPVPAEPNNFYDVPGTYPILNDSWYFLDIEQAMVSSVGGRLLLVNQPAMVVDNPYSDLSYSKLYGRAFYDEYYETAASYTAEHGLWYVDQWQLVPPERYTDSELHMDAEGWRIVADELEQLLIAEYPPASS